MGPLPITVTESIFPFIKDSSEGTTPLAKVFMDDHPSCNLQWRFLLDKLLSKTICWCKPRQFLLHCFVWCIVAWRTEGQPYDSPPNSFYLISSNCSYSFSGSRHFLLQVLYFRKCFYIADAFCNVLSLTTWQSSGHVSCNSMGNTYIPLFSSI